MNWIDELRRVLARLKDERPAESMPDGISCTEAAERIFEWLDGELDPGMEGKVGTHLEACARCYPRLVFEQAFRQALAKASADEAAPDDLEQRILQSLRNEGFGTE